MAQHPSNVAPYTHAPKREVLRDTTRWGDRARGPTGRVLGLGGRKRCARWWRRRAGGPRSGDPHAALRGSLQYATAAQDRAPTELFAVVLSVDGAPSGCANATIPAIATLAASAYNYNGVRTYTVSQQGAPVADLAQIAAAGGGVNIAADVTGYESALRVIGARVTGCVYPLPVPPSDLDSGPVKIWYSSAPSSPPTSLPYASSAPDGTEIGGWNYDNTATPSRILLCPTTCEQSHAEFEASVTLEYGCPTAEPR